MTTRINPQQISVGPIEEVEPLPIVSGGQVWRNGLLVDRGSGYTVPRTENAAAEVQSVEAFIAARRQQEEDILDAAARGDPALLYALLKWALRETSAPSHADLAEWMEEGQQRVGYEEPDIGAEVLPKKRTHNWSEEGRARSRAALERGRAAQQAKREAAKVDGVDN